MQVSVPVGQYDLRPLVNLGTNRWFVKPELGASKAIGPLTLELTTAATILHSKHELLKQQYPFAGPDLLNPGTCDIQLRVRYLGVGETRPTSLAAAQRLTTR